MAVISITITESSLQLLAGIPKFVSVEANVPSSIFYTLDGTDPTVNSSIYVGTIQLPTSSGTVVFKVFATDGVDSSAILTKIYTSTIVGARQTHDTVSGLSEVADNRLNLFPFGSVGQHVPGIFGNTGGVNVDTTTPPNFPDGYDGTATGHAPGGTDLPLTDYDLIYSEYDSEGERGHGIGTLPAQVTVRVPPPTPPSTSSKMGDKFFNPRALVIYQDSRDVPYDTNIPQINRQFFATENTETVRNGALLFNTALEGLQPTGSFLRAHFNPRDQTITYYYFDSATLKWIISKEPYVPKSPEINNLSRIIFSSRTEGAGLVFKWLPFVGRRLI